MFWILHVTKLQIINKANCVQSGSGMSFWRLCGPEHKYLVIRLFLMSGFLSASSMSSRQRTSKRRRSASWCPWMASRWPWGRSRRWNICRRHLWPELRRQEVQLHDDRLSLCLPQRKEWAWDENKMMIMQDPIYRLVTPLLLWRGCGDIKEPAGEKI